jgi:hypothetical protein
LTATANIWNPCSEFVALIFQRKKTTERTMQEQEVLVRNCTQHYRVHIRASVPVSPLGEPRKFSTCPLAHTHDTPRPGPTRHPRKSHFALVSGSWQSPDRLRYGRPRIATTDPTDAAGPRRPTCAPELPGTINYRLAYLHERATTPRTHGSASWWVRSNSRDSCRCLFSRSREASRDLHAPLTLGPGASWMAEPQQQPARRPKVHPARRTGSSTTALTDQWVRSVSGPTVSGDC